MSSSHALISRIHEIVNYFILRAHSTAVALHHRGMWYVHEGPRRFQRRHRVPPLSLLFTSYWHVVLCHVSAWFSSPYATTVVPPIGVSDFPKPKHKRPQGSRFDMLFLRTRTVDFPTLDGLSNDISSIDFRWMTSIPDCLDYCHASTTNGRSRFNLGTSPGAR
jgi:hypothetical protein